MKQQYKCTIDLLQSHEEGKWINKIFCFTQQLSHQKNPPRRKVLPLRPWMKSVCNKSRWKLDRLQHLRIKMPLEKKRIKKDRVHLSCSIPSVVTFLVREHGKVRKAVLCYDTRWFLLQTAKSVLWQATVITAEDGARLSQRHNIILDRKLIITCGSVVKGLSEGQIATWFIKDYSLTVTCRFQNRTQSKSSIFSFRPVSQENVYYVGLFTFSKLSIVIIKVHKSLR